MPNATYSNQIQTAKNMLLYLCLVWKTPEPYTILPHSRSYQLLRYQRHLRLQGAVNPALSRQPAYIRRLDSVHTTANATAVDKLVCHAVVLILVVLVVRVLLNCSVQYLKYIWT